MVLGMEVELGMEVQVWLWCGAAQIFIPRIV